MEKEKNNDTQKHKKKKRKSKYGKTFEDFDAAYKRVFARRGMEPPTVSRHILMLPPNDTNSGDITGNHRKYKRDK